MPDKSPLMPDLFQFTSEELVMSTPELTSKLIPAHARSAATTTASSVSAIPNTNANPSELPPSDS
jgi:hypothetical protein